MMLSSCRRGDGGLSAVCLFVCLFVGLGLGFVLFCFFPLLLVAGRRLPGEVVGGGGRHGDGGNCLL